MSPTAGTASTDAAHGVTDGGQHAITDIAHGVTDSGQQAAEVRGRQTGIDPGGQTERGEDVGIDIGRNVSPDAGSDVGVDRAKTSTSIGAKTLALIGTR